MLALDLFESLKVSEAGYYDDEYYASHAGGPKAPRMQNPTRAYGQAPAADPESQPDTSEERKIAALLWTQIIRAFEDNAAVLTLEWPRQPAVTLTRNQIFTLVKRLRNMSKPQRNQWAVGTLADRNSFLTWLSQLNIEKRPIERTTPPGQMQLPLKEKEESSKYKDVAVARAMRRAQADYPTTSSDVEAFAKSMLDQQEQDQKNIDRLNAAYRQQRSLIDRNREVDTDQERLITGIKKEIDQVEQDNVNLSRTLQQIQAANAELQQKLLQMKGKKPAASEPAATTAAAPEPVQGQNIQIAAGDPRAQEMIRNMQKTIQTLQQAVSQQGRGASDDMRRDLEALKSQMASMQAQPQKKAGTKPAGGAQDDDMLVFPDNVIDILTKYQPKKAAAPVQASNDQQLKLVGEKKDRSPGKISKSEDPCWSGYHMVGTKKKGGRTVPNCVPGKKGADK